MNDASPESVMRDLGGNVETYRPRHVDGRSIVHQPPRTALECIALRPLAAAAIPPRQWAYGQFLLFKNAAALGGIDGGGKGTIAVAMALAMITGKSLLGEHVWRAGPIVIVSYEDDEIEWGRRIAAACLHYGLDYTAVMPAVNFIRRPGGRISFAASAEGRAIFPDGDAIAGHVRRLGAVLLLIDPFNHCHEFEDGNSNAAVAKVAGEISRIAHESGAAALVLHHLRKGSTGAADDLMGATSLRATFRSCRILARMTPDEAQKLNIKDPWRYARIAGTKENYAPPPDRATWFRLASVELGNGTPEYPDGDNVGVATTWQARPMFEGMDHAALAAVFNALRTERHSPVRQSKATPWAGVPLIEQGERSEAEAKKIVAAWIENGVLIKDEFYNADTKNKSACVTLDEAKSAAILANIGGFNATPD